MIYYSWWNFNTDINDQKELLYIVQIILFIKFGKKVAFITSKISSNSFQLARSGSPKSGAKSDEAEIASR